MNYEWERWPDHPITGSPDHPILLGCHFMGIGGKCKVHSHPERDAGGDSMKW